MCYSVLALGSFFLASKLSTEGNFRVSNQKALRLLLFAILLALVITSPKTCILARNWLFGDPLECAKMTGSEVQTLIQDIIAEKATYQKDELVLSIDGRKYNSWPINNISVSRVVRVGDSEFMPVFAVYLSDITKREIGKVDVYADCWTR